MRDFNSLKIAVAGTGYVGLSIATLLSQHHQVTAVDIIPEKVELINNKKSPIQDDYIEKYLEEKNLNLTATLDAEEAYKDADFVVIAAPTNYDSKKNFFDTSAVEAVIKLVIEYNPEAIMVIKSTIPVGYTTSIREKFHCDNIIFSPEFLRESKALYDNLYPSRIIVGTDIENGDFEGYTQKYVSTPLSWKCTGDVRVLSKLGDDIIPYDSRMAFLSTGIGSKEESYISGTQGSSMSQIVKVGSYSTLSFNYDVVSEEPEEWVGSIYNDKFEIQILDENDNILSSEIIEAVNTSTWYSVSGINFDGGDDTVYHTGWATKTIDISNYQNKIIQVRFLVYDVGDSIYDTATVLDNIRLN